MSTFYPLAEGNTWTYRMKDGKTFTNTVIDADGDTFTMSSSMIPRPQTIRSEGKAFVADNFEPGNFQIFLRDDLQVGDTWDIEYRGNNISNILSMKVLEMGVTKEIEGTDYEDVIMIEGEMKMNAQGAVIATNYTVQYYYARDIGLVLTTSSYGDRMGLVSYELK